MHLQQRRRLGPSHTWPLHRSSGGSTDGWTQAQKGFPLTGAGSASGVAHWIQVSSPEEETGGENEMSRRNTHKVWDSFFMIKFAQMIGEFHLQDNTQRDEACFC